MLTVHYDGIHCQQFPFYYRDNNNNCIQIIKYVSLHIHAILKIVKELFLNRELQSIESLRNIKKVDEKERFESVEYRPVSTIMYDQTMG